MDIFHACNYSHSPILVKSFVFQKLTLTSAFQIKLSGYIWCGNSIAGKWGLPRREISLSSFFIKSWNGGNCNIIFFLNLLVVAHYINAIQFSILSPNRKVQLKLLTEFNRTAKVSATTFTLFWIGSIWSLKKRKYFSRDGSTIAWEGILMRLERDWILMISEIGKICPQPYSAPLLSFTMDNILTKIKNRGMNHLTLYTCDFLNHLSVFNPLKSYSFFLQQSKWTFHTFYLCRGEWGLTEYVSRTRNNIKYQLCTAFAVCNRVENSPASF